MSGGTSKKEERARPKRQDEQAATKEERDRQILGEEDSRRAADTAKTAKLRELRLAKEAAEREAAPKPTGHASSPADE